MGRAGDGAQRRAGARGLERRRAPGPAGARRPRSRHRRPRERRDRHVSAARVRGRVRARFTKAYAAARALTRATAPRVSHVTTHRPPFVSSSRSAVGVTPCQRRIAYVVCLHVGASARAGGCGQQLRGRCGRGCARGRASRRKRNDRDPVATAGRTSRGGRADLLLTCALSGSRTANALQVWRALPAAGQLAWHLAAAHGGTMTLPFHVGPVAVADVGESRLNRARTFELERPCPPAILTSTASRAHAARLDTGGRRRRRFGRGRAQVCRRRVALPGRVRHRGDTQPSSAAMRPGR